jgi:hypothetical protein
MRMCWRGWGFSGEGGFYLEVDCVQHNNVAVRCADRNERFSRAEVRFKGRRNSVLGKRLPTTTARQFMSYAPNAILRATATPHFHARTRPFINPFLRCGVHSGHPLYTKTRDLQHQSTNQARLCRKKKEARDV